MDLRRTSSTGSPDVRSIRLEHRVRERARARRPHAPPAASAQLGHARPCSGARGRQSCNPRAPRRRPAVVSMGDPAKRNGSGGGQVHGDARGMTDFGTSSPGAGRGGIHACATFTAGRRTRVQARAIKRHEGWVSGRWREDTSRCASVGSRCGRTADVGAQDQSWLNDQRVRDETTRRRRARQREQETDSGAGATATGAGTSADVRLRLRWPELQGLRGARLVTPRAWRSRIRRPAPRTGLATHSAHRRARRGGGLGGFRDLHLGARAASTYLERANTATNNTERRSWPEQIASVETGPGNQVSGEHCRQRPARVKPLSVRSPETVPRSPALPEGVTGFGVSGERMAPYGHG